MHYKNIFLTLVFLMLTHAFTHAQFLSSSLKKTDMDEVYNDAIKLTEEKRYKDALSLAQKAVKRHPNNPDYNLLVGRLHILMNNPQLARPYIIKVLNNSPNYKDAYYYAINMELAVNNTNQAIAYADRALIKFPNDIGLNTKKLSIYDATENFAAGDALALEIIQKYPSNETAKNAWVGHHEAAGRYYQSKNLISQAQHHFNEALKVSPNHKEATESLTNLSIKAGSRESALEQVNMALTANPNSYDLLMKKLSILQELHLYADAASVSKRLKTLYPNDSKVRQIELDVKLDASRYYEHTDPYVLYQSVLESNPGNQEATLKLIGISMDRGVYRNALEWVNYGLNYSPNNFNLLIRKADILEILDNKLGAAEIINELWMNNPDSEELRVRASELKVSAGKYYMAEKQFDKALAEFEMALNVDPSNIEAVNYIGNIYIEQKDYESALSAFNMALNYRENDEQLLLKKASVLADAGRYNEAFPVVSTLIELYPDNPRYSAILTDQQMQAGRLLMNENEMNNAVNQFKRALQVTPDNKDALTYVINLESGMNRLDSALLYVEKALNFYPDDKSFLLKKVSVLSEQNKNKEAYGIASQLMKDFPYNKSYRDAYLDNVVASGYNYQQAEKWDEALSEFKKVLEISPYDTNALYASINLCNATTQYDSALTLINKGLKYYTTNETLWRQKAATYEMLQEFDEAVLAATELSKLHPSDRNIEHLNMLKAKSSKDQFGIFYHQSSYSNTTQPFRILSLEYRRFLKKASIAGRLNFGTRVNGAAVQLEVDGTYDHTKTIYSNLNIAYSGNENIFPELRLAYSIHKSWAKGWETEIGGRFLKVQTNIDSVDNLLQGSENYTILQQSQMISGVLGLSKSINDFWFNVKGFLIFDFPEHNRTIIDPTGISLDETYQDERRFFQSYQLTSRYYMNERKEFIYVIGGLGTSPDDRSRVIQIPQLSGSWLNQFAAVGYQKTFNYKTTINASVGWSNQKIGLDKYVGQYDIYLALIKRF